MFNLPLKIILLCQTLTLCWKKSTSHAKAMFSTVPCSSRTKPGYVQETSWLRFSQSEIILWIQACLSPIRIEQVGFFNKHIFLKKNNPSCCLYLRCDKSFLGFGRDFSFIRSWHFLSSNSLLILNSSSISDISSELKASWSTLLHVLEENISEEDFQDLQVHCPVSTP